MEFQEVKTLIEYMGKHPYVILHNIKLFAHSDWYMLLLKVVEYVENSLQEQEYEKLNTDELEKLSYGLMILPAIMLKEVDEKSWEVYYAITILLQNYAQMTENHYLQELVDNLSILIQGKDSFKALIIQTESLIVQNQAILNNTQTPYNLSSVFLRSLLEDKDDNPFESSLQDTKDDC